MPFIAFISHHVCRSMVNSVIVIMHLYIMGGHGIRVSTSVTLHHDTSVVILLNFVTIHCTIVILC